MEPEITRLRKMLELLALRRRDLLKITNQLQEAKLELQSQISSKSRARDPVNNQMINIAIIDAQDNFLKLNQEHDRISSSVAHFTRVISTINIEKYISDIISNSNV